MHSISVRHVHLLSFVDNSRTFGEGTENDNGVSVSAFGILCVEYEVDDGSYQ